MDFIFCSSMYFLFFFFFSSLINRNFLKNEVVFFFFSFSLLIEITWKLTMFIFSSTGTYPWYTYTPYCHVSTIFYSILANLSIRGAQLRAPWNLSDHYSTSIVVLCVNITLKVESNITWLTERSHQKINCLNFHATFCSNRWQEPIK